MTLTIIIILLLLGLVLVVTEFFIIPGTTVVGFIGGVLMLVGIVYGFMSLETTMAWLIFSITLALSVVLGYVGLRSNTWQRFAVKSTIDGRIIDPVHSLDAGTKGTTVTPCNPIGKAKFGDHVEEVYSISDFIDPNVPVKILYIKENKIFVEVINP
jgi:membrane-bound ClpP family serine protease